jgi:tetratricopeptide (TPR) repeat protein
MSQEQNRRTSEKTKGNPHSQISEDSNLDHAVNAYIDLLVEEEKEHFQDGLDSPIQQENKIRQQVQEAMQEFYQRYKSGYKAISDAMKTETPALTHDTLAILEDEKAFLDAIENGKPLYVLLGYSFETVTEFYTALTTLFEKEEYEKVRDGFFFLITISPETAEFWTGLAVAETKLKEYGKAKEAFSNALELDPTSQEAYLGCLHTLMHLDRADDAEKLCDQGIQLAKLYSDQEWAQELTELLTEAKNVLQSNFK